MEESDCEEDEGEEEPEAQRQPAGSAASPAAGGHEGSCDENDAGAPNGNGKRAQRRRGGRGGKGGRSKRQEGVLLDDGSRLLSYCRKHSRGASASVAALGQLLHQQSGAAAAAAVAEAARSSLPPQGDPQQLPPPQQQAAAQQAATVQQVDASAPLAPLANPWGSARAAPFNPAARRGSRAPEAVAAAEAKRGYVLSQPYLVGGPRRHELVHSGGRQLWWPAAVPPSRSRPLPLGGVVGQVFSLSIPGQQEEQQQQAPAEPRPQQGAAPPPGAQQAAATATPLPASLRPARRADGGVGSPRAGLLASPRAACKSDLEKYREMVATLGQRVTIGKSGIHGWGAFAKARHATREWLTAGAGAGQAGRLALPGVGACLVGPLLLAL